MTLLRLLGIYLVCLLLCTGVSLAASKKGRPNELFENKAKLDQLLAERSKAKDCVESADEQLEAINKVFKDVDTEVFTNKAIQETSRQLQQAKIELQEKRFACQAFLLQSVKEVNTLSSEEAELARQAISQQETTLIQVINSVGRSIPSVDVMTTTLLERWQSLLFFLGTIVLTLAASYIITRLAGISERFQIDPQKTSLPAIFLSVLSNHHLFLLQSSLLFILQLVGMVLGVNHFWQVQVAYVLLLLCLYFILIQALLYSADKLTNIRLVELTKWPKVIIFTLTVLTFDILRREVIVPISLEYPFKKYPLTSLYCIVNCKHYRCCKGIGRALPTK